MHKSMKHHIKYLIEHQKFDEQYCKTAGSTSATAMNWGGASFMNHPYRLLNGLFAVGSDVRALAPNGKRIIDDFKSPFFSEAVNDREVMWSTFVKDDAVVFREGKKDYTYYPLCSFTSTFDLTSGKETFLGVTADFAGPVSGPGREWYFIEKSNQADGSFAYKFYSRAHKQVSGQVRHRTHYYCEDIVFDELKLDNNRLPELPLDLAKVENAAVELVLYNGFTDQMFKQLNFREAVAFTTLISKNKDLAPGLMGRLYQYAGGTESIINCLDVYDDNDYLMNNIPKAKHDISSASYQNVFAYHKKHMKADFFDVFVNWHYNTEYVSRCLVSNSKDGAVINISIDNFTKQRFKKDEMEGCVIPLADNSGYLAISVDFDTWGTDGTIKTSASGIKIAEGANLRFDLIPSGIYKEFKAKKDWDDIIAPVLGKRRPPTMVPVVCPNCQHNHTVQVQVHA